MLDASKIDELAAKLSQSLPPGAQAFREDIHAQFKQVLQSLLGKMDLVTREEFDAQAKVLARTREKVDALEKVVADIEARSHASTKV